MNSSHTHPHSHNHSHGSHRTKSRKALSTALLLVLVYMMVQVVGGWLANSLALLADAGHMLSDAAALGLALYAMQLAGRMPASSRHTYGYHRAEILAALINGAALLAIALFIVVEAAQRWGEPLEVDGPLMLGVAAGGLLINLAGLWLLHGAREDSLNARGAWLHVLSDLLGSVQAIVAGALIWAFEWHWADLLASVLIALLVVRSAWALLRETTAVLMESAPVHIDVDEVHTSLLGEVGVVSVHDLHIWTVTSGFESLSAHVVLAEDEEPGPILTRLQKRMRERFGIDHVTIQVETPDYQQCEQPDSPRCDSVGHH